MTTKSAFVDYQQRAAEFAVGDIVYPFALGNPGFNGRVVAVFPAIGMVDVEWPHGNQRVPVEDLQQYFNGANDYNPPNVGHDNVPGGALDPLTPGPYAQFDQKPQSKRASVNLVAMYWDGPDRKYRMSQSEVDSNAINCPKCKESELKKTSYKKQNGASVRLLACGNCLFLIKPKDIVNYPG